MEGHGNWTHSSMYLSSREMEYHTMTSRTRVNMARSFKPAGHMRRGARSRDRQVESRSTYPVWGPYDLQLKRTRSSALAWSSFSSTGLGPQCRHGLSE